MNVLLLTSHSIAEYDDLRMLTDLGYDVFSIGAYTSPAEPTDDKRPALDAPAHPELAALCDEQREAMTREWGEPGPYIDWAKGKLHPEVVDWADVIIVHHFPETWIGGQWDKIKHKRVVWRTCGQSDPRLEMTMSQYRAQGLQVVRYSPAERRAFQPLTMWAGEDTVIRFGKYPADYGPHDGRMAAVGNVTQHMAQRGDACGLDRWLSATDGLAVYPAGPGSESLGGIGALPYEGMLDYLRMIRVYLYTGTMPASYTLGLIEAMLSGVPVVSISAMDWGRNWAGETLFEGHDIAGSSYPIDWTPKELRYLLDFHEAAKVRGERGRQRAIDIFGIERIAARWQDFLDGRELKPEPPLRYIDTLPEVAA